MRSQPASYHGYRFPPEIISHAVWLSHRAPGPGVSMARREPVVSMRREPFTWRPHKHLSTDARPWDGVARRSEEVVVLAMGRRGDVGRSCPYPTGLFRRRCG